MDPICDIDVSQPQEEIQRQLEVLFKTSGYEAVLGHLYKFSTSSEYIQEHLLRNNITLTPFKDKEFSPVNFEITINCGKPEIVNILKPNNTETNEKKDTNTTQNNCIICWDNVGKKKGLRAFEFECNSKAFFQQFPPYPYFHQHTIIIEKLHTPQIINPTTIEDILACCEMMPGLKIASNTDKEGTGVTNLLHRHFQTGKHHYGIFQADARRTFQCENAEIRWLKYPCAALQIISSSRSAVLDIVTRLTHTWKNVQFPTLEKDLQTLCMICHLNPSTQKFEFMVIPRNAEKPRFLTRAVLQCIKKEFVGIFEMCGYAIFPGRLRNQMQELTEILEKGAEIPQNLEIFKEWLNQYYSKHRPTLSVKEGLDMAMKEAFVDIIRDNSPFPADSEQTVLYWLQQSNIHFTAK